MKSLKLEKNLVLDDSTVGNEDIYFKFPGLVETDPEGNIYILDNTRVMKLNSSKKLLWDLKTTGQGPGEFSRITQFYYRNGILYICDQEQMKVMLYSKDGKFLEEFKVGSLFPYQIAVDSKGYIWVKYFSHRDKYLLHRFDSKGKLMNSIIPLRFTDQNNQIQVWKNQFNFCIDHNDCIVLAYQFQNLVQKISPEGKVLNEWKLPLDYNPRDIKMEYKKTSNGEMLVPQVDNVANHITVDKNNNIYVLWGCKPSQKDGYRIDVFDTNGTFLTSTHTGIPSTEDSLAYIHADNMNNLYVTHIGDDISLTRYSVKWVK